jgi:hypothetical protein
MPQSVTSAAVVLDAVANSDSNGTGIGEPVTASERLSMTIR